MTRIICIDAERAEVIAKCSAHDIPISMIETLQSGGTRVVLHNAPDAALLGAAYGDKVMTGPVTRTAVRFRHPDMSDETEPFGTWLLTQGNRDCWTAMKFGICVSVLRQSV